MINLNTTRENDDLLISAFQKIDHSSAISDFQKMGIPQTGRMLFVSAIKCGFIKTGILDLAESENLYGVNILFRSQIEHVLKAQYIFTKYLEDKDDQTAIDFFESYHCKETYDFARSCKVVADIFDIDAALPEAANLTVDEATAKAKSKQFEYRSIIRFLRNRIEKENPPEFLKRIIPAYSELSGFVHGGPSSGESMLSAGSNDESRNEELLEKSNLACMMQGSMISWMLLLLYQSDTSYGPIYNEIRESLSCF